MELGIQFYITNNKLLSMDQVIKYNKARLRGLHNLFDFSTDLKIALFKSTSQGFFKRYMFKPGITWTEETVVYILCDSIDEELLGSEFKEGSTFILVQGLLLDCNPGIEEPPDCNYYVRSCGEWVKIRPITIDELIKMFDEDDYYYSYVENSNIGLITGVGVWEES